jgi:O-antigen ligase
MAMVFMISALFVSLSRGGIVAFAGSMVFLISALSFKGRWPRKMGLIITVGLFVSLFVFWLGFIPFRAEMETLSRLLQDKSMHFRLDVWRDGSKMFADFPLFGTGFGTFAHLYPAYKTIVSQTTVMYPENDFFQFLIETGVAGAGLLTWLFVAFFRILWIRWKDHKDTLYRINPKVMIGLVAALVAVIIHGCGDFNLHIPATALHFALVMALAMTAKPPKNEAERSWP